MNDLKRAGGGALGSWCSSAASDSLAPSESGLGLNWAVHSEDALELERRGFRGIRKDIAESLLECDIAAGGYGSSFMSSDGSHISSICPKWGSIGES